MSGSYINSNTRSDTFNQQAAHDTGLYDPNVHDNQIVALYETEEKARLTRDKLIAAGVDSHSIKIMDRGADPMAGGVDYESGNQGIWGAIKSLFMPDEDAHAYSHAIGRGHVMVVVTPTPKSDRHHVIEVLESTDPIDFDAKLEEWRQAGYQDLETSNSPTTGMGETGNATIDRAQTTPANYAVNQTTVTDNIPAGARHTSEMPSGVATGAASTGTGAGGSTGTSSASGTTQAGAPAGDRSGYASGGVMDSGMSSAAAQAGQNASSAATDADDTIPIVREASRVSRREAPQGARRVRSYVVDRPSAGGTSGSGDTMGTGGATTTATTGATSSGTNAPRK